MLEIYFGNDVVAVRKAGFERADALVGNGATLVTIDHDTYEPGMFADLIEGVSLFGDTYVYVIDTPSLSTDMYADVIAYTEQLNASAHTCIVLEDTLLAAEKKKWQKHASVFEEYKRMGNERFNTFALADTLARKDKKALWLTLNEARMHKIAAEECIGILWWQLKSLLLAAKTDSAEAAGMKSFPYNKAKRSLTHFKDGEVAALAKGLITLQHDARRGIVELDTALEEWVLAL